MFNEALDSVNKVLETDPENVKALYRCGKVHMVKGDFEEAVKYLQKASNIDPEEKVSQNNSTCILRTLCTCTCKTIHYVYCCTCTWYILLLSNNLNLLVLTTYSGLQPTCR